MHILSLWGCSVGKERKQDQKVFLCEGNAFADSMGNCPCLNFKPLGKCLHVIDRDLLEVYQLNSHRITPVLHI